MRKAPEMTRTILRNLSVALFALVVASCSKMPTGEGGSWVGYTESGQASFYADKFQNRKTASGEPYRHHLETAAHKKLPFGSIVKVTNKNNGRSVIVRINDRGPFVKGRVIDLSKSAFSRIGSLSSGLVNVKIDVIR
jgi:rare lipoprotein A